MAFSESIAYRQGRKDWLLRVTQIMSCRATGSAPTAEGHLPWPVRRCGTPCLTIWEIRLLAVIASDARWKRFCLRRTETCSAFGVLRECAIQIYFYLLTFTYLCGSDTLSGAKLQSFRNFTLLRAYEHLYNIMYVLTFFVFITSCMCVRACLLYGSLWSNVN